MPSHVQALKGPTNRKCAKWLLEWVTAALPVGKRMSEREVSDRLALVVDDVVTLGRYLVDAGMLARTPDGAVYQVEKRYGSRTTSDDFSAIIHGLPRGYCSTAPTA
ncbi:DUF2087 domain-containing protein [Cryobacterium sp. TMT1-3]|uniref:DUF2087 domain-containing protein n=1 Tax=Cryobacterium luteum TaxID=1424661 RepID=A0A5F0D1G0_9MICO|nr:DUF2087 domain-containing protein [Cryobacterium luteum]TFC26095.1 DUF2087 domain-containing protein [Cryobacterium sp. TMT1-3]